MIRGTTPRLEFTIPFDTGMLDEAFVTLSQNREVIIDKALDECKCEAQKLTVQPRPEDTLKLACDRKTEIQIRARTVSGDVFASDIFVVDTDRILKDGVI